MVLSDDTYCQNFYMVPVYKVSPFPSFGFYLQHRHKDLIIKDLNNDHLMLSLFSVFLMASTLLIWSAMASDGYVYNWFKVFISIYVIPSQKR